MGSFFLGILFGVFSGDRKLVDVSDQSTEGPMKRAGGEAVRCDFVGLGAATGISPWQPVLD
jgi:hypothetical protein